jgi:hypothetical protein
VKANKAQKTYIWHLGHIQRFCDGIPKSLTINELKPFRITRIMDAQAWAPSTKNGLGRSVQRAMRWANRQGLIERNPIAFVEKPGGEAREVVVTPEDFLACLTRQALFHPSAQQKPPARWLGFSEYGPFRRRRLRSDRQGYANV